MESRLRLYSLIGAEENISGQMKKVEELKRIKGILPMVIICAVIYGIFHLVGIGCPIKFITGISCPGCGMTRAVLSILKLNFKEAFYYHPLVYILPFAAIVLLFKERFSRKFYNAFMIFCVILLMTVYVIRIIVPNEIVVVDPKSGFMVKLVRDILGGTL